MKRPFISIIITVLNGAKTITQCLNSISCQTFTNYEVVIIDGGSEDNTILLIEASSIANKIVKAIPGIGLYAGLNAGIDTAIGEWFYFMGCDDLLFAPSTLNSISQTIKPDIAKIFTGSVRYVNGFQMKPSLGSPYLMNYVLHHQGTFYHRSIFSKYRYDEKFKIASDYDLNTRLRLNQFYCEIMDETIAYYGDSGISSKQYRENFAEVREINRHLFSGPSKQWIIGYCWVKQSIWLTRKRVGLLNLKHRLNIKFN